VKNPFQAISALISLIQLNPWNFFQRNLYYPVNRFLTMEEDEAQKLQVKKDLANLTRTLTSENLNPSVMFTKKRGIRSCTPSIKTAVEYGTVSERLKRVQIPE
jgi:hypothetical protein